MRQSMSGLVGAKNVKILSVAKWGNRKAILDSILHKTEITPFIQENTPDHAITIQRDKDVSARQDDGLGGSAPR